MTVTSRRDDGALLAVVPDSDCAVIISPDGKRMWPTTIGSAVTRGNWEPAVGDLTGEQISAAVALLRANPQGNCVLPPEA